MHSTDDKIYIYTDGCARGNPGPGGYGIIMRYKGKEKVWSAGYRHTTNNRMELLAVIEALKAIQNNKKWHILIVTDSKYVVDAVEQKWVFGWQKSGFKGKKNADLWMEFLRLYPLYHIQFKWIKGHNGHPENERCDQLAVTASMGKKLLTDTFYESTE